MLAFLPDRNPKIVFNNLIFITMKTIVKIIPLGPMVKHGEVYTRTELEIFSDGTQYISTAIYRKK